ncbi:hypothetical protein DYB28_007654 [Aphanomyces astaci]|uniref:BZIP domain-containing protein n=1 Tax=Aphanomyces astaci TaxID=112090 RepID=A0A9X8H7I2_APHAT|nr:hypothetical protein DYB28_007654 [Aphanomyces astaci]
MQGKGYKGRGRTAAVAAIASKQDVGEFNNAAATVLVEDIESIADECADAMILQYFMDFTDDNKVEEAVVAEVPEERSPPKEAAAIEGDSLRRLKEKQNKHRLNNIRHRQRKQSENDHLRTEVVELEDKLNALKASSARRGDQRGKRDESAIRQLKEQSQAEKRKRTDTEDEHGILLRTVHSQRDLIQMYFKRITATHCMHSSHVILENEPFLMYTLMGCRDVRANGYDWIMGQMKRKMDVALTYLHSYVGNHIEEDTKIYLGHNTVDLVRNHIWTFPAQQVAQSSWDSFTRVQSDPTAARKTLRLEEIDANTFYTRIIIDDGIVRGKPLTLNMLQRLSFEPNPDGTTHARVFVKFRTDHSNGQQTGELLSNADDDATNHDLTASRFKNRKTQANQWIMSVISKMFTAVNGTTRQSLRAPPPATTSLTVLKKHDALRDVSTIGA